MYKTSKYIPVYEVEEVRNGGGLKIPGKNLYNRKFKLSKTLDMAVGNKSCYYYVSKLSISGKKICMKIRWN